MGTLVILLGVAVVFIVVVSGALHGREQARLLLSTRWEPLAQRLGGRLAGRAPKVLFSIHGREAVLERVPGSENDSLRTAVRVNVLGLSSGALRIFTDTYFGFYKKITRMQDLTVGDRDFDRDFVVQANPARLAEQVFSPDRRSRVVGMVRRLHRLGLPRIDLSLSALEVVVWENLDGVSDLLALVQVARGLVEILLELSPAGTITFQDLERPPGALCPVCSTALDGTSVDCAKCRTPHHEECWRYAGRCSMYACQEKAFVKEGRRVLPRETRQKPDEWLRDELARNRREYGPRR